MEGGGLFGEVGGVLRLEVVDGLGWRGGWLERGRFEGVGGRGKGGAGGALGGGGVLAEGWRGGWKGAWLEGASA